MSRLRRVAARLRGERGFTLIESLTSMVILMTVMGGMTALMVSGTNAEADLNRRFQAQTDARIALDRLRRDIHCARSSSTANPAATIVLDVTGCSFASGTNVTWCVVASGTGYYAAWRYDSSTCSGTGRKVADYLTTQSAFTYTPPSGSSAAGTGARATLAVTLAVNLTPSHTERVYRLDDTIVLRNSARPV